MIARNFNGNGFRGTLEYNLDPQKGRIIGHENMMGNDARALSGEFGVIRRMNQKVQTPVYHVSLSLADNERGIPPMARTRAAIHARYGIHR